MIKIRKAQIRALSVPHRLAFAGRMLAHVERHFPEARAALGRDATREAVSHGMARAEAYGLESDGEVCAYINVMFMFGRDFDRDPELPWAAAVLCSSPASMAELHAAALEHLAEARGLGPAPIAG